MFEGIYLSQGSAGSVLAMIPTLNEQKGIGRVLEDVPKDIDVLAVKAAVQMKPSEWQGNIELG